MSRIKLLRRFLASLPLVLLAGGACNLTTANPTPPVEVGGAQGSECRRPASASNCERISSVLAPTAANPQGRWSLGWQATLGATLTLYDSFSLNQTAASAGSEGIAYWRTAAANWPFAALNPTCRPYAAAEAIMEPGQVVLHPGGLGQYSLARWSPSQSGVVHVRATFSGIGGHAGLPNATTDVHVRRGAAELAGGKINLDGAGNTFVYDDRVPVAVNDALDFAVGFGNGDLSHDGTGVDIEICY
jgi:hypothetical protein